MQNYVNVRALFRICAIVLLFVLVVAVPAAALENTEPLLEKTISFKANFTCSPPDCCTQCSVSGMYFPVTFEVNNPQDVKAIKVHYNVIRPNYLLNLVLYEYEACSGQNCYGRGSWLTILSNKGGVGDASVYPNIESGITSHKYKIRAELQNPIGSTREDTDVFIKVDLVREIPQTAPPTMIPLPVTTTITTMIPKITPTTIITSTAVPTTLHTTAITTIPTSIPTTVQITSLTTAPTPAITSAPTSSVEKLLEEQNKKIDAQNTLIAEQNQKMAEQNDLLTQILNYFKGIFGWK